jgi:hypothetical protein
MADDKTKHAQDRKRIDVHQDYELQYWTKRFGISKEELMRTVEKVGPMVEDVERELASK